MLIHSIRCSSLPLAFACGGAVRTSEVEIDRRTVPAAIGSAVHDVMRAIVLDSGLDMHAAIASACAYWGLVEEPDQDDVARLCWTGLKLWREQLEPAFRNGVPELHLSAQVPGTEVSLTGHVDLLVADPAGRFARVPDWKTGRKASDYRHQVMGYGTLVLLDQPELEFVETFVVWLRDQTIEKYTMTRAEMRAWLSQLRDEVIGWSGRYNPGEHCRHCSRSHECPALVAQERRDLAILTDAELVEQATRGLADLPPARVVELYRKAKTLRAFLDAFDEAVRVRVSASGGLDDGSGKVLQFEEEEHRQIDPVKAWPAIEKRLTDEEIAACIHMSISKIESAVAAKAGKGKGAAAKRELAAELEAAGAIGLQVVRKLKEVRK